MPQPAYKRIISLVPSLTELLIDLGLKNSIVGRTRFCIHPEKDVQNIPILGGTKNPDIEKIRKLNPDFILVNKEENRREDVEELQKHHHVYVTDINSVSDALIAIHEIGLLFGKEAEAEHLISQITILLSLKPDFRPIKTVYFIWKDPLITVSDNTYIHDVMKLYNLDNMYALETRYPLTSLDELARKKPELILLSSEPFPFSENHIEEFRQACPDARIELVDGEWFSWYGSRMPLAITKLNVWRKEIS